MNCSTDRSAVWGSGGRDRQGDGCSSMVDTFGTLVAPLSDELDARAMPAVSPRRHVGHGAVMFAVGLLGNWITAEVKIRVPRIAVRPAAGSWGERAYFFGGGQARDGGERCAHRGFQRRGFRVDCRHGGTGLE